MASRYATIYERLVANTEIPAEQSEATGCWVWTGTKDRAGYGRMAVRKAGRKNPTGVRAHRAMMTSMLGRELHPDDETVEHLCACTSCVNPDHLVLLTRAENTAAMRRRVLGGGA